MLTAAFSNRCTVIFTPADEDCVLYPVYGYFNRLMLTRIIHN
ncbi:hypothetical protein CYPRO_2967 [Cyclonatronum proteinivorum]|uniref:Uncharacterized protein n=1 Tax=Cyclonatronum proteinivorum TaxID=1457365 RepID=A0A345UP02_9BACT|nr:hypothetical protein CYPRO_2967 [Cyclonatronum proteinivorum]